MWWPEIDKQVEELVRSCDRCQYVKSSPAPAPLHPWIWPSRPWQRIHLGFAGPFKQKMFLIIVDAHSKWSEVIEMSTTSSERTIEVSLTTTVCEI